MRRGRTRESNKYNRHNRRNDSTLVSPLHDKPPPLFDAPTVHASHRSVENLGLAAGCFCFLVEIQIDDVQPGGNWAALRGIMDDLRMPGMDGATFLRWVKKSAPGRAVSSFNHEVESFKAAHKAAEDNTMKRILVVDDDPSILLGICRSLRGRRNEWEPILALDTEEACMRLDAASDIDVLVCDLTMPGEGGVKVLRHAMAKYPLIARIVLSGHGRIDAAKEARELCHRFLDKPCPTQLLQDTIQWAIDRARVTVSETEDPLLR